MKRILFITTTMLMLFGFSVSADATTVPQKLTKISLMLDWFVNPNHGPIIIAQERGYFKQHGIEVDIQQPADPSLPPKLVAANKIDLAVSYQPNLTIDVAAGLPLIKTATLIATPLNTLMVLKKSGITDLSQLKGKTIGISVAGNEDATIGTMLADHGVKLSDVNIVNVGWALSSSLASGKVDAIWGGLRNFETNQLALEGYPTTSFFPEENGIPSYDELIFVANSKHYNRQAITAFNTAIAQATTYIINHPDAAWKQFIQYAPDTLDNKLNHNAWNDTLTRFALRPAAIDFKRYDDYAQFLFKHHVITQLPQAKNYIGSF